MKNEASVIMEAVFALKNLKVLTTTIHNIRSYDPSDISGSVL